MEIKFPSGLIASELFHFMGADDERNLTERPLIAQQLVAKCSSGKSCDLTRDELNQLIAEVDNALDIKHDHIGTGEWTSLHQYHLQRFFKKITAL